MTKRRCGWRWVTPGGWRASSSFSSCPLNHSPDLLVSTFYLPTALSLSLIFNPFDRERQKAEEHYNWYHRFEEANIKSAKKCVGELKFRYIVRMVNDHWSFTSTTSKQKFRNEQWEISYGFHSTRLVRSEVLLKVHCHSCYAPLRRPYENWPKMARQQKPRFTIRDCAMCIAHCICWKVCIVPVAAIVCERLKERDYR